jgi:hypothetical protein
MTVLRFDVEGLQPSRRFQARVRNWKQHQRDQLQQ